MPVTGPRFSHGRSPKRLPSRHAPITTAGNPALWEGHVFATPSIPGTVPTYPPPRRPTTHLGAGANPLSPMNLLGLLAPLPGATAVPGQSAQELLDALQGPAPKAPALSTTGIKDTPFTKAQLHPNERQVGEHELEPKPPTKKQAEAGKLDRLYARLAAGYAQEGKPGRAKWYEKETNPPFSQKWWHGGNEAGPEPAVSGSYHGYPKIEAAIRHRRVDPLGKHTLGNVSALQLQQAREQGTLRRSRSGVLTTPAARQAMARLRGARQALRASGSFGPTKPSGQLTPEEWAQIIVEEGRKLHAHLTPHDVAEGVGVIFAESGGTTENTGQVASLGTSGAHIGPWSEEESGFGSYQERLDPHQSTNLAIQRFLGDERSWNPAWVHWQEIQGENETGADRAPGYLGAARQALQGGQPDPQAVATLKQAVNHAEALGINVPAPGQKQGDFTYVHQTAKTALTWAEHALGVSTGSPREVHFAELVGGVTDPWCAVFVSTALKKVGIEPPANPSYSGAFLEDWKGGKNLNTTDLSRAKPGDVLVFDWGDGGQTDHVAIYKGGNQMIGGNQGPGEVSLEEVPASNIVGIVRPNYTGKQVAVSDAPVPGGAAPGGGTGGVGVGAAPSGLGGTSEQSQLAQARALAASEVNPLPRPAFSATPLFANTEFLGGGEDQNELLRLLTQPGLR